VKLGTLHGTTERGTPERQKISGGIIVGIIIAQKPFFILTRQQLLIYNIKNRN
jgi:hypothetical protein